MGSLLRLLGYAAARLHLLALVGLGAVLVATVGVLWPRPVDQVESFVPGQHPQWHCTGWTFDRYPPGVMDARSVRYCVGFEHPLPPGSG